MLTLVEVLSPDRTRLCANLPSQKRVLEFIADIMANTQPYTSERLFDALIIREHLGTTAIGQGVALPHASLHGVKQPIGCFVRLDKGVDYQADDKLPVDLLFAMLIPPESKEEAQVFLKDLAKQFHDAQFSEQLRQASSREVLYRQLVQESSHSL